MRICVDLPLLNKSEAGLGPLLFSDHRKAKKANPKTYGWTTRTHSMCLNMTLVRVPEASDWRLQPYCCSIAALYKLKGPSTAALWLP